MTGVEIDMVVNDSLKALEVYEKIFEVKRIEVTDYPKGSNEAVFTIYETRFHMLDENPEYQLAAPQPGQPQSIWYNVLVPDILATYEKAMAAGCTPIQPITEMPEMGASNAMFADAFGYVWMLHQIHREVRFEDRCKAMEEMHK
ncbi:VOC family protein [Eubacterium sp. 1001713B170207_170306_E7]|uniref:VOC family protein n=1 Tax=Eubacterium sp. 1001713B170207_170306_E7 TaxID=2787097 RepID=UPI00189BC86E|nr:VOC family protein [Eubacterium sp. 1001713B170207_170306_E7]